MSDSEQRRRTGRLPPIRCFEDEEEAVREKARDCGMSVGQFLLAAALQKKTRTKVEAQIINELRKLGGLQKHLFKEGQGVHSKEYAAILMAIQDAISRIGTGS